jgi:hypothetical protein
LQVDSSGRKKKIIRADESMGRDAGKHFLITEWYAERAEKWALRALLAYNRGGGEVPVEAVFNGGMEGIFWLGINTFLRGQMKSEEVIPILDELLECVQMVRDPNKKLPDGSPIVTPIASKDDIGEIKTRLWLRSEVLELHTGFSVAALVSKLISAVMEHSHTQTRKTSPGSSRSRSPSTNQE